MNARSWLVAATLLCGLALNACGESSLPAPVRISLQAPGELAHLQFETAHTHGFYVSLRLRYPPGDPASQVDLRLPSVTIATHLTIRRTGGADPKVVFDDAVDAMPMGYAADAFDRSLRGKFVLPSGRYDVVVTLLAPAPRFASYPTELYITSDRGHASYPD